MTIITTLRSFRVSDIAMFDLIASYLGMFILDYLFGVSKFIPGANPQQVYYLLTIPIAVLAHLAVGQRTTLNSQLFSPEFNIYKLYFIFTLISIGYLMIQVR
jgi:hypothetical protein